MKFELIPRSPDMLRVIAGLRHNGAPTIRMDDSIAPIMAENLRHTFKKILEYEWPELAAEAGKVLPIDTEVNPADTEWVYHMIEDRGVAVWIDDDGTVMGNSATTMTRHTGKMHEMGFEWMLNVFDLERDSKAGTNLAARKGGIARRAHSAKTNHVWLFGASDKDLFGLCNHPNICVQLAPQNAGASSRLWTNKTNDEILADLVLIVNTVPQTTKLQHFIATVFMSFAMQRELRDRRLGAGDGFASLWDLVVDRYKGDTSGQGKIEFKILREAAADWRRNPETNADDSGLSGDFLIALPKNNKDVASFVRARPFTQVPPQQDRFNLINLTHSKIGGCKLTEPLAVCRMDFGTT